MICMVIIFFFFFNFQFIVKSIYQPTEEGDSQEDSEQDTTSFDNWNTFFQKAAIIQHCMCYFNSAINPIIYYFMSAQFKVIIYAQFKVTIFRFNPTLKVS